MTSTDTTNLAEILSAKKAMIVDRQQSPQLAAMIDANVIEGNHTPEEIAEIMADARTGEIVPETAVEVSPIPPAVPAPVEVRYPEIPPKVVGGLPYVRDYMKLAKTICNTEFVPTAFRGRPTSSVPPTCGAMRWGSAPCKPWTASIRLKAGSG